MKVIHKCALLAVYAFLLIVGALLTRGDAASISRLNLVAEVSAHDFTRIYETTKEWSRRFDILPKETRDELTGSLIHIFPSEVRVYFLPEQGDHSVGVSVALKGDPLLEIASFKKKNAASIVDSGDLYATAVWAGSEGREPLSVITLSEGRAILWHLDALIHCRFIATGDIPAIPQKNARKGYAA